MTGFSRRLSLAVVTALVLAAGALASEQQGLRFDEAWVRALPPGMKMTAGFGRLRNLSETPLELVGFSSPQFADVSLHRTETADGVSRMREVSSLQIGPGETVDLAPGGYHLMLMRPAADWSPEQPVVLQLQADDGTQFEFRVPVERR